MIVSTCFLQIFMVFAIWFLSTYFFSKIASLLWKFTVFSISINAFGIAWIKFYQKDWSVINGLFLFQRKPKCRALMAWSAAGIFFLLDLGNGGMAQVPPAGTMLSSLNTSPHRWKCNCVEGELIAINPRLPLRLGYSASFARNVSPMP